MDLVPLKICLLAFTFLSWPIDVSTYIYLYSYVDFSLCTFFFCLNCLLYAPNFEAVVGVEYCYWLVRPFVHLSVRPFITLFVCFIALKRGMLGSLNFIYELLLKKSYPYFFSFPADM